MINKIKNILNELAHRNSINEILPKKQLDKILPNLILGIEIEVIHESGENVWEAEDSNTVSRRIQRYQNDIGEYKSDIKDLERTATPIGAELYEEDSEVWMDAILTKQDTLIDEIAYNERKIDETRADTSKLQREIAMQGTPITPDEIKTRKWYMSRIEYLDKFIDGLENEIYVKKQDYKRLDADYTVVQNIKRLEKKIAEYTQKIKDIETEEESDNSIESLVKNSSIASILDESSPIGWEIFHGYHHGRDFRGWRIEPDGSLGNSGVEFISPKMPYGDFIEYIPKVATALNDNGFLAEDGRTGLHIGVSSKKLHIVRKIEDDFAFYRGKGLSQLMALLLTTQKEQRGLFVKGEPSRESSGYSKSITDIIGKALGHLTPEDDYTLEDLIYTDKFESNKSLSSLKESVSGFVREMFNKSHYTNVSIRDEYVEVRSLGGVNGYLAIQSESSLREIIAMITTQLFSEAEMPSTKELVSIVRSFLPKSSRGNKDSLSQEFNFLKANSDSDGSNTVSEILKIFKNKSPNLLVKLLNKIKLGDGIVTALFEYNKFGTLLESPEFVDHLLEYPKNYNRTQAFPWSKLDMDNFVALMKNNKIFGEIYPKDQEYLITRLLGSTYFLGELGDNPNLIQYISNTKNGDRLNNIIVKLGGFGNSKLYEVKDIYDVLPKSSKINVLGDLFFSRQYNSEIKNDSEAMDIILDPSNERSILMKINRSATFEVVEAAKDVDILFKFSDEVKDRILLKVWEGLAVESVPPVFIENLDSKIKDYLLRNKSDFFEGKPVYLSRLVSYGELTDYQLKKVLDTIDRYETSENIYLVPSLKRALKKVLNEVGDLSGSNIRKIKALLDMEV